MDIQKILIEKQIVHSDSEIMGGVPVFIGTRVPLQTLFDYFEGEGGLNPHSALQFSLQILRYICYSLRMNTQVKTLNKYRYNTTQVISK